MRIGIIGLGTISRFYLAALDHTDGVHLAAACDVDVAALQPLRHRVPCSSTTANSSPTPASTRSW